MWGWPAASLKEKINRMFGGEHINSAENRSVLHVALHAPRDAVIQSDGENVVPDVWEVLEKIQKFSEIIRRKALKDVIAVGISGSFLGPLQTDLDDAFHFVNL
ncbi:unnamed protein product [Prunus armeniaca]|uniref:Uncharacterized protein n=1 Tax=Prunus armeniaca TaxID=36596 RepID=A0A6J5TWS4_PRUAR|nr:unnamed protein product [Prunus armeniaca]